MFVLLGVFLFEIVAFLRFFKKRLFLQFWLGVVPFNRLSQENKITMKIRVCFIPLSIMPLSYLFILLVFWVGPANPYPPIMGKRLIPI